YLTLRWENLFGIFHYRLLHPIIISYDSWSSGSTHGSSAIIRCSFTLRRELRFGQRLQISAWADVTLKCRCPCRRERSLRCTSGLGIPSVSRIVRSPTARREWERA